MSSDLVLSRALCAARQVTSTQPPCRASLGTGLVMPASESTNCMADDSRGPIEFESLHVDDLALGHCAHHHHRLGVGLPSS